MADDVTVERTDGGGWVGKVNGQPVLMVLADRRDYWIEDEARGARNLERHGRQRALACEAVLAARRAERERTAAVPSEDWEQT